MHGLGNDFVFIDHFVSAPAETLDYPELSRKLCHRQFGVGGDGLIVVLPSEKADARMRIFNSDGSEPEMCGNGIRCFARYIYDQGHVTKNPLQVETLAGILTLHLTVEGDKVTGVRVDMGEPILKPEQVPVLILGESVVGPSSVWMGRNSSLQRCPWETPIASFLSKITKPLILSVWVQLLKNILSFLAKPTWNLS